MSYPTKILLFNLFIFTFTNCTYDNLEELLEESNCPTEIISYENDIIPIFDLHCNNNICHGGSFPQGRIGLSSYNRILEVVEDDRLLGSINHAPGFDPMPLDSNKLSDCEIFIIQQWVDQGALEN